jgi:hypothetical protein
MNTITMATSKIDVVSLSFCTRKLADIYSSCSRATLRSCLTATSASGTKIEAFRLYNTHEISSYASLRLVYVGLM